MECYICGNEMKSSVTDDVSVCAECAEKAKNRYILKCLACGAYGFLERTQVNKARLETLLEFSIDELAPIILIPFKGCPNCAGKSGEA
ncbi:hypothetical protein HZB05_00490 [Candidatus Wolfebacteria bacterium]|nr:hypothetical protein [Candidatus Wolfebacteria bacterium]